MSNPPPISPGGSIDPDEPRGEIYLDFDAIRRRADGEVEIREWKDGDPVELAQLAATWLTDQVRRNAAMRRVNPTPEQLESFQTVVATRFAEVPWSANKFASVKRLHVDSDYVPDPIIAAACAESDIDQSLLPRDCTILVRADGEAFAFGEGIWADLWAGRNVFAPEPEPTVTIQWGVPEQSWQEFGAAAMEEQLRFARSMRDPATPTEDPGNIVQ